MSKLIIEGRLINAEGEDRAQVEINTGTGLIEKVGEKLGVPTLSLKNELIFPGFVDLHVHAREDMSGEQMHKESFLTASEAAINGGVVCFMDMPNNPKAPVDGDSYLAKDELVGSAKVPIILYAGIGPHTHPLSQKMFNRIFPYKAFMGPSVGDLFFEDLLELEKVIKKYEGQSVSFHCEDPLLLKMSKDAQTHEERRPRRSEVVAICTALGLIERYDLAGKICHVSTKEGLQMINGARDNGINVTCEVTPHHLYFDRTMLTEENRLRLQMNPPLRGIEDRVALIQGLRRGDIEYLATDHAPHTTEEKQKGMSGVPHLDTYGAFTTWLMKEHKFSPQDIVICCSYNPGIFLQKFTDKKFGRIDEGYVGSLTIIDMDMPTEITRESLKTKCGWSPFEGVTFPGSVKYTIVAGKVYEH